MTWWRGPRDRLRRRRTARAVDAALADTIDLVVLAIRAGMLPVAAMRSVLPHCADPIGDALAAVLHRVDDGERFSDALPSLSARLGPALDPLVDGLAVADRDGLPLGPVLERLAADARAHRRRQVEAAARQLPVRLALPLVLCTLPSFVLLAVVPLLLTALASLHR
jgi:tight adherence protein C